MMITGGLKLVYRFGSQWASIETGGGLMIGLHPASELSPAGRKGSTVIGLALDRPIDGVVAELKKRGLKFSGDILEDNASRIAYLEDPEGNELYLNELRAEYRKYAPGATAA